MGISDTLLTKLLQTKDTGLKISIYQSTHPASTGQAVQEDIIRFKNSLQAIRSSDKYDDSALAETMSSLEALLDERDFWIQRSKGLAVFADQEGYEAISFDYDISEFCHLGDQYQVSPLALAESLGTDYYLLDINHTRPRLLKGTVEGCTEVDVDDMPGSLDDMMENVEFQKALQHQSGGVGAFHGHNDKAALEDNTMNYYRSIARAVDGHLNGHSEPLILMGVENRVGSLRKLLQYPNTLEDYIEGNVESMNEQELQNKATPVVEEHDSKRRNEQIEEFKAAPPQLAATLPDDVRTAAEEGRVAKLFVPYYRRTNDTVRDDVGESIVLQVPEDNANTESLVRTVLEHGGEAVAVALDAFDDEHPRALCRY